MEVLRHSVNSSCSKMEPWQIVGITAATVLAGVWFWEFLFQEESLVTRGKKTVFKLARKIPFISQRVEHEMKKISEGFEQEVIHRNQGNPYVTTLPEKGKHHNEVIHQVEQYLSFGEYDWRDGFVSGAVYNYNPDLIKLLTEVYGQASYTNPLHPDVFPGVCKMEAEVVRITANLFHGGPKSCGTMTTGGTESILMACKAYRDCARTERGVHRPEIVIPMTAHPAFEKAAAYFGLRVKRVPVDPDTTTVDIKAMRRAISRNTCMVNIPAVRVVLL